MPVYKRHWKRKDGTKGFSIFYKFMIDGVLYKETVPGATTIAEGKAAEAQARQEVEAGLYQRNRQPIPFFNEFIDTVYENWARENKLSFKSDLSHLKPLREAFGKKRLNQISPFDVERYKSARRKEPKKRGGERSGSSVNRELEVLSRIFTLAIGNKLPVENPCAAVVKLAENPSRERRCSPDEEAQIRAACNTPKRRHVASAIILAIETGLRPFELFYLKRSQISLAERWIHVVSRKTGARRKPRGHERYIPISDRALVEIEKLTNGKLGEFVFPVRSLKKAWKAICAEAGIVGLRFRDLRHEAASRWDEAGMSPFEIAYLLGHSDVKTTGIYVNSRLERIRERMNDQKNCTNAVPETKKAEQSPAVNY